MTRYRRAFGNVRTAEGFTLMELMVTVAVVAILGVIAYPSYVDYIHRANRAEGQAMLSDAAAREERYFSNHNQYTVTMTNLQYGSPAVSDNQYYSLTATSADTSSAYTLTVTAQGAQCTDTSSSSKCDQKCYKMTLDSLNKKTSINSSGSTNPAGTCWK